MKIDIDFLAVSSRFFQIAGRVGFFSVELAGPDYCNLVHHLANGMRPATNMRRGDLDSYLSRELTAGRISWLSPVEVIDLLK